MIRVKGAAAAAALKNIEADITGIELELERLHHRIVELSGAWAGDAQVSAMQALQRSEANLLAMRHLGGAIRGLAVQSLVGVHDFDRKGASAWQR